MKDKKIAIFWTVVILVLLCLPLAALASSGNLPYQTGLKKFTDTLKELAPYIALAAFFAAGVAVMIGGELSGWVKQMVTVCCVVGTIAGAQAIYDYLFGAAGCLLF